MNFGASAKIFGYAKLLRSRLTPAEEKLWEEVRDNKLGVRFRRQHPISKYVVDFYCHKCKLVIELDGEVHSDKTVQLEDQNKQDSLVAMGLTVIRFTNTKVLNQIEEVVLEIEDFIKTRL